MHPRYFFFLLFAIPFLHHCKKDDPDFFATKDDLVPLYFFSDTSTCTAKKEVPGLGSINWTSNIIASNRTGLFNFTFITFESAEYPFMREHLSISRIPIQIGNTVLQKAYPQPYSTYHRLLGDGDLLHASWELDPLEDNQIEIVQLDTVARIVKGKFNVHFIRSDQSSVGVQHSEQINFKKGYFETKY